MRAPPQAAPKRFYDRAEAIPHDGAHAVALDGRLARTPGRRVLAGPAPLAAAMADEWEAQGETLDVDAMPLTRLQGRFLDTVPDEDAWARTARRYAASDLLCYRGDDPGLAKRQAETWQPYLDRLADRTGARLVVTEGVMAVDQPPEALARIDDAVAAMPPSHRYAARLLTEIAGSAVLALSVLQGDDAAEAFAASRLDEAFQAERWGLDAEAAAAEARLRVAWDAAVRFAALSVAPPP